MVDGLYQSSSSSSPYFFSNRIRFMAIQCMNSPIASWRVLPFLPGALGRGARKREWIAGGNSSLGPTFGWFGWAALGTYQWARDLGGSFIGTTGLHQKPRFLGLWPSKFRGTVPRNSTFFFFSKHESFLYTIITVLYICRIFCCPECE